jgi:hypothetical protein
MTTYFLHGFQRFAAPPGAAQRSSRGLLPLWQCGGRRDAPSSGPDAGGEAWSVHLGTRHRALQPEGISRGESSCDSEYDSACGVAAAAGSLPDSCLGGGRGSARPGCSAEGMLLPP